MSGTYNAAKTLKQRWFIKEAYPLYAVIGAGSLAAFFMLGRTLVTNPDARYIKKYRMEEMGADERDTKRGDAFYNHSIRKAVQGASTAIFPNQYFTKPQDHEEGTS